MTKGCSIKQVNEILGILCMYHRMSFIHSPATQGCYTCHFWFILNDEAFFSGEEETNEK